MISLFFFSVNFLLTLLFQKILKKLEIFSIAKCGTNETNGTNFPHCASKATKTFAFRGLHQVSHFFSWQKWAIFSKIIFRYIEGLTTDSSTMSNWERQLKASKELVKCPDEGRLPAHWLANNGDHGTSLDALWALRDFLMCDSMGVTKIVQGPL